MKLKNKNVLITGAARRLGKVMALAAAEEGANIIIHHSSSPEQAQQTKNEILELGQQAAVIQADFLNPNDCRRLMDLAYQLGPVDTLINSSSLFGSTTWDTTDLDSWEQHFAVNLTAPFLLSQIFGKRTPKNHTGRIINILDWRALRPGPDHFPYTISKSGLLALTKSMAISLAPRITVNGLAFGAILPPSDGGDTDDVLIHVPAQRWANMAEVKQSILFLLTAPSYITGEVIHLDGGRHLI